MSQQFLMVRDVSGENSFGLLPTDYMYSGILTSDEEQILTIPVIPLASSEDVVCIFSPFGGSTVWVSYNQTAELPTGDISQVTSECNPTTRQLKAGDTIHFITNDTYTEYGVIIYPK